MNRNGYAALAVDKLVNGASSHPNPAYDVQLPLQIEAVRFLTMQIKEGTASVPPKLICVSHSSGSILGANLAQVHPADIDAGILTEYFADGANNKDRILSYHYLPTGSVLRHVFPADLNYGSLMNSELNRTSVSYQQGHYDPISAHLDYLTSGSQPPPPFLPTPPAIEGKIPVVTGLKDPVVCGLPPMDECDYNDTRIVSVNPAYSSIPGFDFHMPITGHDLNGHYGVLTTFELVVKRLEALLG